MKAKDIKSYGNSSIKGDLIVQKKITTKNIELFKNEDYGKGLLVGGSLRTSSSNAIISSLNNLIIKPADGQNIELATLLIENDTIKDSKGVEFLKDDKISGYTIYSSLEQLGVSASAGINKFVQTMKDKSILFLQVDKTMPDYDYPYREGTLIINKASLTRCTLEFYKAESWPATEKWVGIYNNRFSGWTKVLNKFNSIYLPDGRVQEINEGEDLNNFYNTGFFYCVNATNKPVGSSETGYVFSYVKDGTMYSYQEYIELLGEEGSKGRKWLRQRKPEGWQTWQEEANTSNALIIPEGKTVKLPDKTNLDTVEKTGLYSVYDPINAPKDAPSVGYLTVKRYNGTNMVMVQEYEQFGGAYGGNIPRSWKRICIAGSAYGEWVEQLSANNGILTPNGRVIGLAEGTDLDTITKTGFYDGNTLINRPPNSAIWGYIEVFTHSNGTGRIYQKYTEFGGYLGTGLDGQPRCWIRIKVGETWKPWIEQINETNGILTPKNGVVNLSTGSDLNTIIKTGFYAGSKLLNKPVGSSDLGYVSVLKHWGGNDDYVCQTYEEYGGTYGTGLNGQPRKWTRVKAGDVWKPWVEQLNEDSGILATGGGIRMVDSVDLDSSDIKIGFYYARSCTNRPIAEDGYLSVENFADNTHIKQTYTRITSSETWTRVKYGGNWEPWVKQLNGKNGILTPKGNIQYLRRINLDTENIPTGLYYAVDCPMRPLGENGYLLIERSPDNTYCKQTYTRHSTGETWLRVKNVGVMGEWKKVAISDWKPLPLAPGFSTDTGKDQAMYCDIGNAYMFRGRITGDITNNARLFNLNHGYLAGLSLEVSPTSVESRRTFIRDGYIKSLGNRTSWVMFSGIVGKP